MDRDADGAFSVFAEGLARRRGATTMSLLPTASVPIRFRVFSRMEFMTLLKSLIPTPSCGPTTIGKAARWKIS